MTGTFRIVYFAMIAQVSQSGYADPCSQWEEPQQIGELNTNVINEASGLAKSSINEDAWYHINDSGDGPYVYETRTDGRFVRKIEIDGFDPGDVEDLAIGPCLDKPYRSCLVVADIGDNRRQRSDISLQIISEADLTRDQVTPRQSIAIKYPDGPRDAESVAVDEEGTIYILSKESSLGTNEAWPARLYRLTLESLRSQRGRDRVELEFVREVNLPQIQPNQTVLGKIATAMDYNREHNQLIVLTYENAIVFDVELSNPISLFGNWSWTVAELSPLEQQEAVSWASGDSFIYSSESRGDFAPLMQVECVLTQ